MKLLWLYLLAFLVLPIIGEVSLYITGMSITAGIVDLNLIIANIIFVFTVIIVTWLISNIGLKISRQVGYYDYQYTNFIFKKIIILLLFIAIFIFTISGYSILFGGAERGDIRVSLGFLGPFYTVFLNFIPVLLVVYASMLYAYSNYRYKLKKKIIFIFILLISIGIFSGYKAVALSLMIPGFVMLYFYNFKIKHFFIFIFFAFSILTVFTALVRDIPLEMAFPFLVYRMTTMTAYGTIGVWNEFNNIISFNDFLINLVSIFGNKLSSFILGISQHDVIFLKTSLSRLITYLVYPNTEGALSGTVNVTVTNFGHAIYLLGKSLYVYYALFMGVIIGFTIRYMKIYMGKKLPLKLSIVSVFFFSAIIPSVNSGGIFTLFSLPILVNLIITYFIGRYLIQGRKVKYAILK